MRSLFLLLAITVLAHAQDTALKLEGIQATLTTPENWKIGTLENKPVLVPKTQTTPRSTRQHIHFVISRHQADTLEDAMNAEINSITERSPNSSNAKTYFIDAIPLKTRSGVEGILARFAYPQESGKERLFTNQKFYFRDASGKIVTVCMHVWGDEAAEARYRQLLVENLVPGN
ncbi:MAG: hypothetical protein QM627_04965 [Luteolibacter sp.]